MLPASVHALRALRWVETRLNKHVYDLYRAHCVGRQIADAGARFTETWEMATVRTSENNRTDCRQ